MSMEFVVSSKFLYLRNPHSCYIIQIVRGPWLTHRTWFSALRSWNGYSGTSPVDRTFSLNYVPVEGRAYPWTRFLKNIPDTAAATSVLPIRFSGLRVSLPTGIIPLKSLAAGLAVRYAAAAANRCERSYPCRGLLRGRSRGVQETRHIIVNGRYTIRELEVL